MLNPFGVPGFLPIVYPALHAGLLSLNPFGIRLLLNDGVDD
jgi:hypothetical protein